MRGKPRDEVSRRALKKHEDQVVEGKIEGWKGRERWRRGKEGVRRREESRGTVYLSVGSIRIVNGRRTRVSNVKRGGEFP